jgi:glycosyltransferase involved in cell wall biosynthesis
MSRRLRVVHIVRRFDPLLGGLERYVGDLARAQAAAGRHVTVVTLDRDVNGITFGRFPATETDGGVEIVRLPGFGSSRFAITTRPMSLIRVVRRSDVVHLHDLRFMFGTSTIAARLRRRPTLLHTHGLIYGTRAFWRLKRLASRLYYEPLLRFTRTQVIAGSPADRARLGEQMRGLTGATTVIESGADLSPFRQVQRRPVASESAVLGRVTPIKGIDRVLRALSMVDGTWSLKVHGAGEGTEPARLLRLADELGIADRLAFTGSYVTGDEPGLLATPALAVFPSTSESLGMALIDAMAAGVPVLASDIPAHRDVLGPAVPEALLDFDRPELVAAAINHLLAAPDSESSLLTTRLQERASFFDVTRLLDDVEALYSRLGVVPQQ